MIRSANLELSEYLSFVCALKKSSEFETKLQF